MVSNPATEVDAGSFRDRDGRVYHFQGRVFRGLSESALECYRNLRDLPFFQQLVESGKVVTTREISQQDNPLPGELTAQWAGFVEHDVIPVISYPYEWTFSMLKAAAQLQLHLVERAVSNDFTLKDATPYNIQFVDRKPVFIDVPSFEPLQQGEPWSGYRQFCEMFLFPLMLQAYKGCNFQPFMRAAIDGVDVQTAVSLFGFRDRFRKGVLSHVWLQSKLDRRYGGSSENVRSDLKSAGFNRELILVNVRKLQKLVSNLAWEAAGSEWGDYTEFHNYSEDDHELKEDFVRTAIKAEQPTTVWDIGCNTGQFSRIAAENCKQVVATDIDHVAAERLFLDKDTADNILPLVQNVADPSPNWGWRNCERSDLQQRSKPDLVLCLALIHHVVITANIPLAEFIDWLAGLTDKLVIEYVSRADDKVQTLLRNKEDKYQDYSRESLQANLKRHFDIRQMQDVNNGDRTLFLCVKIPPPPVQAPVDPNATAYPNGHFYSPTVNTDELRHKSTRLWSAEASPVLGIDFNREAHKKILGNWFPRHISKYDFPEVLDDPDNEGKYFYTRNSQFSWLDSRALFVFLNEIKPARMIEIGSGYSSLLSADVNRRFLNNSCSFQCIEPYPREFLVNGVAGISELIVEEVQNVPFSVFETLQKGDILFIDSSHVSKTGSDVNYIYFDILPRLKPGVIIHIHDIFLPHEYPKQWVLEENRSWNEQYLLRSLLMYSNSFEVLFGCNYAFCEFPQKLISVLNLQSGKGLGGGSFWITKIA